MMAVAKSGDRAESGAEARPSEEETAFLLRLGDVLRSLDDDVPSMKDEVARILGGYLHVTGVTYGQAADYAPSLLRVLEQGRALIVPDVASAPELGSMAGSGIGSFIGIPWIGEGRLAFVLNVHHSEPRAWTEGEVKLVRDVAERTGAALEHARRMAALRANEERYRAVFESIDEALCVVDVQLDADGRVADLVFVDVNRAFERQTGIAGAVSRKVKEVTPHLAQPFGEALPGVLDTGQTRRVHHHFFEEDRWCELRFSRIGGKGSRQAAIVLTCMTERRRTAERLFLRKQTETFGDSEGQLKLIFDMLPIGVALFDLNGDLLLANEQMHRFMPTARIPGLDDARYGRWRGYDERGRRLTRAEYPGARALRGETVVPGVEFLFDAEDGTEIWTRVAALPVRGEDGAVTGAVAAVTEIDALKRTEEALRASEANARRLLEEATTARAQAESANRAKDEFLATLSHELRTPLSAILLWTGALRSGSVPLSGLGRAVDAIMQSAESQSRLIEDLLDLSRLSAGKLALSRAAVEVESVLRAAVEMVRPLAVAKGLSFVTEVDGRLGRLVVDAARLKQILWNLLANATKFTPAGGKITLHAARQDGQLLVEVKDTGEGIAPEFMPHVFEKFRQADMGDTRRHMGLGIGLALSKQLVELHGGSIEAESEGPGQGAVFRFRLPWVEPSAHPSPGPSPAPAAPVGNVLSGVRVLLVEDDTNTRAGMAWTLERAGAEVVAAATAAEALSVVRGQTPPEVIVCDLGLPQVSGLDLVEQIAKEYADRGLKAPPSCAVSAHARDVDRQRAIAAGFDMYLAKPITPERLVEAVTDLHDVLTS